MYKYYFNHEFQRFLNKKNYLHKEENRNASIENEYNNTESRNKIPSSTDLKFKEISSRLIAHC